MSPLLPLLSPLLIAAWNILLLAVWAGRFRPDLFRLADVMGRNFPSPSGWPATLAGNWAGFLAEGAAFMGIVAVAGALGRGFARWTSSSRRGSPGVLVEYGTGLGFLSVGVLGAGLDGLLFAPPRGVGVPVLAVLGARECWRMRAYRARLGAIFEWPAMPRAASAALALLLAVSLAGVLNIELGWDALTYHLRLPSFYLYRHKLYDAWHSYYAFFPSNVEMLFMAGQAACGDLTARLLNALFAFLLLATTARTARALGVPAGWPVLLVACSPLFLLLATRCYADLGAAFFVALSLLLLVRWRGGGGPSALVASGVLAGFGMGSKLPVAAFWFAAAFALAARSRGRAGNFALWNCALWPVFLPWLARSFLLRGNPVYPFLSPLLGMPASRAGDYVLPFEGLSTAGSTVRNALSARLEAIVFDAGHIEGPMVPVFGGILPFLAFRPVTEGGRMARRAVAAYFVLWIALFPEIRFILPVIPAMAALAFGGLHRLVAGSAAFTRWARATLVTSALAGAMVAACLQLRDFHPLSIPLGLETPREKAGRLILPAPFTGYLAGAVGKRVPPGDRILFLCHFSSYYVERECITDVHFGRAKITDIIREGRDADGIARRLRQRGIGWLLLTGTGAAIYRHVPGFFDVPDGGWEEWKRMLERRTGVAWQTNYYVLLRVTPPHEPRPLAVLPVYEALEFAAADEDLREGRFVEAAVAYLKCPPLLEDVGSRWSRLGIALGGMGRHAEALRSFENATSLGFRAPRTLWGMAVSLLRLKRPEEALRAAEEAWGMDPRSAPTAALLAALEAGRGRREDALGWARKAVDLEPGSAEYGKMLDRLAGD
jgi:hypothetical protein